MTQRPMRIGVIGAGLAGLACALAAAGRGLQVQLFDEAGPQQAAPAPIEIVPNMLRDLVALGVGDDCVRSGFAFHGVDVLDRHGRHLHALATARLAGERYPAALGMRHADLHRVLERALQRCGGVVRRGSRVQAVRPHDAAAAIELADGERVPADLVVLAAGAGSRLRAAVFPEAPPAAVLPQTWWYALLPRPVGLDRPLVAFGDAGHRLVLVPVRHDEVGIAVSGTVPGAQGESPVDRLRRALAPWAPGLRQLAGPLRADTPVVLRRARSGLLQPPWHRGLLLAVGDCAHALPPHFGQAAAQAVEDARVLAELLAEAPHREALLDAFQQRRDARVRKVHEITNTAAHWDLQPRSDTDLSQLMQRLMHAVAEPA